MGESNYTAIAPSSSDAEKKDDEQTVMPMTQTMEEQHRENDR